MKKIWEYSKEFMRKLSGKQKLGIVCALFLLVFLTTLPFAFAALTPVRSVFITSENLSYQEQEPGAWQIEKSAEWTGAGKARITFELDTIRKVKQEGGGGSCLPDDYDLIFAVDTSGSMTGDKLTRVQQDSSELIADYLEGTDHQAAVVQFADDSTIVQGWTNQVEDLTSAINGLEAGGSTNYYRAFINIDTLLKEETRNKSKGVIVLFLTDGYPNIDTPNEQAYYQYLKDEYCDLIVNGVQYEMGEKILEPIKRVSDNQFQADMETLNNVLFEAIKTRTPGAGTEAANSLFSYEEFVITDYIDDTYFDVESIESITTSIGEATLTYEGDTPVVKWDLGSFPSGSSATMTIDIILHDEYVDQGGTYPTNIHETITSTIDETGEDIDSEKTPVLADNYKVIYEGNAPEGCTVSGVPETKQHGVYSTVEISTEEPTCEGYIFKGWSIITEDVTQINDDYFIMPESDVILRAEWGKTSIAKSMDGTVFQMGEPIMRSYTSSSTDDYHNSTYKSNITSIVTKDNIDIPESAIEWWDVSEAGDGSVIAYIEDDGTGTGTYNLTIGGTGGIIANEDSSYLFYDLGSVENIDLTYLDTSNVTNMSDMFCLCDSLTNIIFRDNFGVLYQFIKLRFK